MQLLSDTIDRIAQPGLGILAADESTNTIGKRFDNINLENNFENRRQYRSLLTHTNNLSKYIAGIILFEETLEQKDDSGKLLVEILNANGILPGIKVDKGTSNMSNFPNEKITAGLDGLADRVAIYKDKGARFAKWRNVMVIGNQAPSEAAVFSGSDILARYAAICQNHDIVPIVEPEILMDGNHSLQKSAEVTEYILKELFIALKRHNVKLEYTILKPNMVLPGVGCDDQSDTESIASATVSVLKRSVPSAVPCINFLSGGQTPLQSTERLNAMNQLDELPWVLSYSYGRALQEGVIKAWGGKPENVAGAQQELLHRAKMNSLASQGKYSADLEK